MPNGDVVYWMSRDQRAEDNRSLLFAQDIAQKNDSLLKVVFCLTDGFLGACYRHYAFMIKGLKEVHEALEKIGIPFYVIKGDPEEKIPAFCENASAVVTDFDPLKIKRKWQEGVKNKISAPFHVIDSHNIVPCTTASDKKEYAAYTIRPKILKKLDTYLTEFAELKSQKGAEKSKIDWNGLTDGLNVDRTVGELDWIKPGSFAAKEMLSSFIKDKLHHYADKRNDPNADAVSNLSPYLHFGQISAQRVALEVSKFAGIDHPFLEEIIIRKELSDNFCYYNKDYDNFEGFPDWAKKTLAESFDDKREYIYSQEEFDKALTHDRLWNAAQIQMVRTGKMHGYLRMYWAKKILEWSEMPQTALRTAISLNDRYSLDGRDPNGYAGIAWSIGGVHDRAWFNREVFGKIRYMSYNGCKSKFDIEKYIESAGKI